MKHFTVNELCVSASHPKLVKLPAKDSQEEKNLINLIERLLDPIREKVGKPITVTSGYRPQQLNTAVHGAKSSNHLVGKASDCHTGNNSTDNLKIVNALMELGIQYDECIIEGAKFSPQGQLISCQWVHLAYSEGSNRKRLNWTSDFKTYHPLKVSKNTTFIYHK